MSELTAEEDAIRRRAILGRPLAQLITLGVGGGLAIFAAIILSFSANGIYVSSIYPDSDDALLRASLIAWSGHSALGWHRLDCRRDRFYPGSAK